ncbi:SRPBCC family protein [Sandaracinus amylolyticus]|uniref:Putative glutathione S-transferase-related transmembrane protein n=1 Tax=Sandaracinus amylolyticus TaxID=927083 RepID=A0A0F6VZ46_9BACT|nr:SRPBCC family protein [Sandaracinus amylolyticus]AKF03146.1 Putative glutathione S-transferase-related transmembrane protein [Sandaracinus amylolyticus]
MSEEATHHDVFTVERTYRAAPERVFDAWADPAKKRRWFAEGEGWTIESFELDFREGGLERTRFRFGDGPPMTNDTVFHDIVANRRVVYSYGMTMSGKRFSVSLATLVLERAGSGTRMRYTEQIVLFGQGREAVEQRRLGCGELLERLAAELGE